jgi:transcriptional regulator with XRE-family HTH domain
MEAKDKLTVWMQSHRMTRDDLAKGLGLSSNFLWRILSGNRPMTDSFRWKFGMVYGFDIAVRILLDEPEGEDKE